jgi:hypothetical protein
MGGSFVSENGSTMFFLRAMQMPSLTALGEKNLKNELYQTDKNYKGGFFSRQEDHCRKYGLARDCSYVNFLDMQTVKKLNGCHGYEQF